MRIWTIQKTPGYEVRNTTNLILFDKFAEGVKYSTIIKSNVLDSFSRKLNISDSE